MIQDRKDRAARTVGTDGKERLRGNCEVSPLKHHFYGPPTSGDSVLYGAQWARALLLIQQGRLHHLLDCAGLITEDYYQWVYFIDFHREKMEVWRNTRRGICLEREVTFETLREDPEYMIKTFDGAPGDWED
ncbi:hypothetical protein L198_07864 [Cryptococcus wingfieldii CBS 7118]|uniref:Uncharacterized protein n=1 Tax=Cryptococcus wingfieldii CBS 7118 TaxID=1295528 RepID=A0A1E3HUQ1_9TREE|nr:hypothetical protein L198_07864 [Cryptococcus wingfieldii CBS 7118]ODN80054.1 hypothetical protein L198_07864 [Cryptococcus wingfieldii CBS 7118]